MPPLCGSSAFQWFGCEVKKPADFTRPQFQLQVGRPTLWSIDGNSHGRLKEFMENTKSVSSETTGVSASGNGLTRAQAIAGLVLTMFCSHAASGALAPVDLGTAGNYAILTKTGISSVPPSAVTGAMAVSPIDSTAITVFSLIMDPTTRFSRSTQVTGKIYAADYTSPTPIYLTTAVGDMETAYTDAAGRTLPDHTELGNGNISGLTLAAGLYKWGTGVDILSDVVFSGSPTDVWILQVAGNLTVGSGAGVQLSGGAQAKNIFWQIAGGVGVALGTTSHLEGVVLAAKAISLKNGATVNGRLLAQAAVTLDGNAVTAPASLTSVALHSASALAGPYANVSGQSVNYATRTITTPQPSSTRFYRLWANETLTINSISVSAGNLVITYE